MSSPGSPCALLRLAAGTMAGAAAAVWAGLLFGWAGGGVTLPGAAAALAIGLGAALATGRAAQTETMPVWRWPEWLLFFVGLLAGARAFFWLIFPEEGEWLVLSPFNLGDLSLHLHLIQYLAGGAPLWPESPILTGTPLVYPVGSDFFNALLLAVGIPTRPGLIWCGILALLALLAALLRWGGWFAVAALFFSGAFAYVAVLSGGPLPEATTDELPWRNLFLTVFVTQRGMLYALPAGLLLLASWRDRAARAERVLLPVWAEALLYGAMPLFSVHTFLALSIVLAGCFLLNPRRAYVTCGLLAFLPATLGVLLVTDRFGAAGGVGWLVGWMMGEGGWRFWAQNFGLMLPLAALLCIGLVRGNPAIEQGMAPSLARGFVWPAAGLFLACCFVRFAPWPWDNIKLMLWSWLAIAPFLDELLLRKVLVPFRLVIYALLFLPGAVALGTGLDGRHGYELANQRELDEVRSALRGIPAGATFAAAPEYNHPLILTGRKMVAGYEGHLFSHGLDYRGIWHDLGTVLSGRPGWEAAADRLGADYVFWGRLEKERYPDSQVIYELGVPVRSGPWGAIYPLPRPESEPIPDESHQQ